MKVRWSLFVFIFPYLLIAQQATTVDSLRSELALAQADTTIIQLNIQLADALIKSQQPDTIIELCEQTANLINQLSSPTKKSKYFSELAQIFDRQNNFQQTINYYREALHYSEVSGDTKLESAILSLLGRKYRERSDYIPSLEYYQKALKLREKLGDEPLMASTQNRLGILYSEMGDFDKSEEYFLQSLKIREERNDKQRQGNILNNLGWNAIKKEEYDKALSYLFRVIRLRKEMGSEERQLYPKYNIGSIYEKTNQLDSALIYLEESFDLAQLQEDPYLQTLCLTDLGKVYRKLGNEGEALSFLEQAYSLTSPDIYRDEKTEIAKLLYEIYKEQNNLKQALKYHESFKMLQDTVFNQKNNLALARMEAQAAFEQEKQRLEFEKAQEKASRQAIGIALVCAIILVIAITWYYIQKRRDNEKLKKLNVEILSQKAKLEELDQLKSRFFANISHELRTPLTLILGPIQSIFNLGSLGERQQYFLKLIQDNAHKLLKRTNDILDLTKLEAKKLELQEVPTNIHEFSLITFSAYESAAEQKGIQMKFDYRTSKDLDLLLDRDKFDKILSNYISNALKYTGTNGQIGLTISEVEQTLIFALSDTGGGIAPDELPHIFDRYYQARNSKNKGGTGIGLAFCRELAGLMGGKVWAESKLNEGSTFYVQIPIKTTNPSLNKISVSHPDSAPDEILEAVVSSNTAHTHLDTSSTILLVEDNPTLRKYIKEVLVGYQVNEAENGKQALEVLGSNNASQLPSLIVSDIMMPEMDGYELLNELKTHAKWKNLPLIMLTALAEEQDKLKALRIGVDDYLTKPFSPDELKARIANLINNHQERQAIQTSLLEKGTSKVDIHFEAVIPADQEWLTQLEVAAKEALAKQIDLNTDLLADHMSLSSRQLLRRTKALTGLSIKQYIQEVKLQKARHLLENKSHQTIAEIAYLCGFKSPGYFSKVFERHYGKSPSAYIATN